MLPRNPLLARTVDLPMASHALRSRRDFLALLHGVITCGRNDATRVHLAHVRILRVYLRPNGSLLGGRTVARDAGQSVGRVTSVFNRVGLLAGQSEVAGLNLLSCCCCEFHTNPFRTMIRQDARDSLQEFRASKTLQQAGRLV